VDTQQLPHYRVSLDTRTGLWRVVNRAGYSPWAPYRTQAGALRQAARLTALAVKHRR